MRAINVKDDYSQQRCGAVFSLQSTVHSLHVCLLLRLPTADCQLPHTVAEIVTFVIRKPDQ